MLDNVRVGAGGGAGKREASSAITTRCTIAGLLLAWAAGTAGGQVINSDQKSVSADVYQSDQDFNPVGSPHHVFIDAFDGLDFSDSASTSYNDMGLAGSAFGAWNHAYTPGNAGLGNPFSAVSWSGSATSESASAGTWRDDSFGNAISLVYFSVPSDTAWTFTADVVGTTSATGDVNCYASVFFLLYSADFSTHFGEASHLAFNGESINESVAIGGVIPAGDYVVGLNISAYQFYVFGSGTGSSSVELTNGLFTIPAPGAALAFAVGGLLLSHRRR